MLEPYFRDYLPVTNNTSLFPNHLSFKAVDCSGAAETPIPDNVVVVVKVRVSRKVFHQATTTYFNRLAIYFPHQPKYACDVRNSESGELSDIISDSQKLVNVMLALHWNWTVCSAGP